jgi:hypothetical protein
MGEMQKVSEIFKSNLNYYQRVAHKKLSMKNVLLDFQVSLFLDFFRNPRFTVEIGA